MASTGLPQNAKLYIAGTVAGAMALTALLWHSGHRPAGLVLFLVVLGLGTLAHAFPVRGPRHQAYQATLPFIVVAAAAFSTLQLAAFIVIIHLAEQLRLRRKSSIQLFNTADYLAAALFSGLIYRLSLAASQQPHTLAQVEAALAAGVAFMVVNRALLAGALWFGRRLSPARSGLWNPELLAADLAITWVCAPILVMVTVGGAGMVLVASVPLYLARPALSYLLRRHDSIPARHLRPASAA